MVVFLLPITVQFLHSLEGHEETVCTDTSTHIHEDSPECQICHFNIASFNYDTESYPELEVLPPPFKVENNFSPLPLQSNKKNYFQLRAPPHNFS
tara:strand:+ start:26359 stop:26643 length:285 start_codon:yes stop_codon:yes gene_type:complete